MGDKVYLNVKGTCKKLQPLFKGLYEVVQHVGEVDYAIQLISSKNKKEEIVHQCHLKLAYDYDNNTSDSEDQLEREGIINVNIGHDV